MRIAMVGTGYVGLVSGACFSEFGIDVVCVDTDNDKIDRLNRSCTAARGESSRERGRSCSASEHQWVG